MASADRTCGMDPAYGDGEWRSVCCDVIRVCVLCVCLSDLWSGGFSSEEDEAAEAGNQLDLLASLVAERGEREREGEGEGEGEKRERKSHFRRL